MVDLAQGWTTEVDRGPDWIFIRLHGPADGEAEGTQLAEMLWDLTQCHMVQRVVLELDEVTLLRSYLVGQLVLLHKRITTHGGVLRLSGLSPANEQVLYAARLNERLPNYHSRSDAVHGHRPMQPR